MNGNMTNLSGLGFLKRRKGLLISPELCTGCRGCQSACKEWNKLPAEKTRNLGTYENPPDLTPNLYNRIRFVEKSGKNGLDWLFISRRCMHCGDAGCMAICPAPGALHRNRFGFVVFNKNVCIGCKLCRAACPFDIPRYDASEKISKCHLCSDRVENGLPPACAKTCPTGAIAYGDRADLIARAGSAGYKTLYGRADLAGLGVMYAFREKPEFYGFPSTPGIPGSVSFWRSVLKPLALVGLGASVAAAAVHYLAYGPHDSGDDDKGGEGE
jgi:formate dehydrogenase iron-sulfur subunit